jgi:hypothetical protein
MANGVVIVTQDDKTMIRLQGAEWWP